MIVGHHDVDIFDFLPSVSFCDRSVSLLVSSSRNVTILLQKWLGVAASFVINQKCNNVITKLVDGGYHFCNKTRNVTISLNSRSKLKMLDNFF